MSKINNIQFDSTLLNLEAHCQNLKIASLNLFEFNKRILNKEQIQFEYLKINNIYTFRQLKDSTYQHYSDHYLPLNWFVSMSRNPQWHSEWVKSYPERMYSYFFEYFCRYGKKEVDLFVQLFKDFIPLGNFLSEQHRIEIKSNFNRHCQVAISYR